LFLLLILPLYGNIDARIDAIQKASVEERFKLMNAFKKEVVHMKEEERIDAITKLKSITRSRHSSRALKELKDSSRPVQGNKTRALSTSRNKTEVHLDQEDETEDHIEDETEDHIEDETEDHIEDETEDHIEDEHDDDDD